MSETEPDWRHYIEQQGYKCPYCGSVDLEVANLDVDAGYIHEEVTCPGCKHEWGDVYRLVDVYLLTDDGDVYSGLDGPEKPLVSDDVPDDHPDSEEN